MHILLLRNYAPDGQPSMRRFADQLEGGLRARGVGVDVLEPAAFAGRRSSGHATADKWLRYVDKYVLFPPRLRGALASRAESELVVHICDHSNAVYVPSHARVPHVVTCHDLLAVRAARGEFAHVRTGWAGRQLQQAICRGLGRAGHVTCDSTASAADLRRIVGTPHDQTSVVAPAVSQVFTQADEARDRDRVCRLLGAAATASYAPYILHVGGNQWYKNRAGVIEIYAALGRRLSSPPRLVMAGRPLTPELRRSIEAHGLGQHVVSLTETVDEDLAALYACADLFLFPSIAEGFGWPVIEALACGARVVTSGREPLIELAGDAAVYIDPDDVPAAAATIAQVLAEPAADRPEHAARGRARAARFSADALTDGYIRTYRTLLDRWHRRAA